MPLCQYFLLIVLIDKIQSFSISQPHLQTFFNSTFDSDHNGSATYDQFATYFKMMEPEGTKIDNFIDQTFKQLDIDQNSLLTLQEIVQDEKIGLNPWAEGHNQVHLGFTGNEGEMQVMWVSNPGSYENPYVLYGRYPSQLDKQAFALTNTYNVGHIGFHGKIYTAVMKQLIPKAKYFYKVGDKKTKTFSPIRHFTAPPKTNQQLPEIRFATMGDVGTFAPFGYLVMNQISKDNLVKPYDFVFLTGDIAYAGVSSEKAGEMEPIWDLFGELSEPFASYTPFVAGSGNHQKYYNFTSYFARYNLPKRFRGQTNLWFSFDYGQLHIAYFSSEHDFHPGSDQYNFLEEDLKNASSNPNTKWIIVGTHRPFYSSNQRQYSPDTSLAKYLEQLMRKYKVDIVQNGHIHSYQRTWPVYRGKVNKTGHTENEFHSPDSPIYVVQATGGAMLYRHWVDPVPEWSIKQMLKYGYGQVTIIKNVLKYDFISAQTGEVLDSWKIIK